MKNLLAMMLLLMSAFPLQASDKLIQLIEYIGADYKNAVHNGEVASDAEYGEMLEFASLIPAQLPADHAELNALAATLQQLIQNKADVADIKHITTQMRHAVIAAMPAIVLPLQAPDRLRGQTLYQTNCAVCHGANAMGDGPAGAALDPSPTNFHEHDRYAARSAFGLFNTISLGVEDTGMQSFRHLDAQSRWDLAFYVGAIASEQTDTSIAPQAMITKQSISKLLTSTPQDLEEEYGEQGASLMALFRQHPESFFNAVSTNPLQIAQDTLALIEPQVAQKNYEQAYNLAVSAYLDGFELIENNLVAVDAELKVSIERKMLGLRQNIKQFASVEVVRAEIADIQQQLLEAKQLLESGDLASGNVFLLALLILLREGLEALLVVAAIYTVAVKTEQPRLKRSVHYGWGAALALGLVTWIVASFVITISGASREMTEGYTALIAAGILFYMGFWMHSKTSAIQWQRFINAKVSKSLKSGAYFGLGAVVFLAVYREVFETILFYQSLWLQGGAAHQGSFVSGILVALVALAVLGVALFKYAVKLPLKAFFGSTAMLMIVLAVVMVGKGVTALQEAGIIAINHIAIPTISWLGIFPSIQSISAQLLIVVIASVLLLRQRQPKAVNTQQV